MNSTNNQKITSSVIHWDLQARNKISDSIGSVSGSEKSEITENTSSSQTIENIEEVAYA